MKFLAASLFLALCLALASADPEADAAPAEEPVAEYLPPAAEEEPATKVAEDGYRYKTVRRLRYRHRREVNQEYLPPPVPAADEPSQEYLPPDNSIDTKVADDGYRYKTVRRFKVRRHRRDVSEVAAPSNEYLPPVDVELAPELKTAVDEDGYRYRTVRRLKFRRHRRDAAAAEEASAVSAPANEYLPPAADAAPATADAPPAEAKSAQLAKDGYRYKTVRRIRYRFRH